MGIFGPYVQKINYKDLTQKADNYRNNGQVDLALGTYLAIEKSAGLDKKTDSQAYATLMAGVAATLAVKDFNSSYYQYASGSFRKAFYFYKITNGNVGKGVVCREAGNLALNVKEFDQAREAFDQSIHILEIEESFAQLGLSIIRKATLEAHFNKSMALDLFERGITTLKKEPTAGVNLAEALYEKAVFLFKDSSLPEAEEVIKTSQSWFEAKHSGKEYIYDQTRVYGLLYVIYWVNGRKDDMSRFWKLFGQGLAKMDVLVAQIVKNEVDEMVKLIQVKINSLI